MQVSAVRGECTELFILEAGALLLLLLVQFAWELRCHTDGPKRLEARKLQFPAVASRVSVRVCVSEGVCEGVCV